MHSIVPRVPRRQTESDGARRSTVSNGLLDQCDLCAQRLEVTFSSKLKHAQVRSHVREGVEFASPKARIVVRKAKDVRQQKSKRIEPRDATKFGSVHVRIREKDDEAKRPRCMRDICLCENLSFGALREPEKRATFREKPRPTLNGLDPCGAGFGNEGHRVVREKLSVCKLHACVGEGRLACERASHERHGIAAERDDGPMQRQLALQLPHEGAHEARHELLDEERIGSRESVKTMRRSVRGGDERAVTGIFGHVVEALTAEAEQKSIGRPLLCQTHAPESNAGSSTPDVSGNTKLSLIDQRESS